MNIIRIVLELGKSSMHVLAEYQGVRRNIKYTWQNKVQTDVPPSTWRVHVQHELEDEFSKEKKPRFTF